MKLTRILLSSAISFSLSCGHRPIEGESPAARPDLRYEDLDLSQSFAFVDGKDAFYFAKTKVENGPHVCWFFVGLKNDALEYFFPADRLAELHDLYYQPLDVKDKKSRAIAAIKGFAKEKRACTAAIAERQSDLADKIEAGIYITMLLPFAMISAVTFAAKDTVNEIRDHSLRKGMKKVRLGQTEDEVATLLNTKLKRQKTSTYEYYAVDSKVTRLALYFENGRLNAFVRGYHDRTQHP